MGRRSRPQRCAVASRTLMGLEVGCTACLRSTQARALHENPATCLYNTFLAPVAFCVSMRSQQLNCSFCFLMWSITCHLGWRADLRACLDPVHSCCPAFMVAVSLWRERDPFKVLE